MQNANREIRELIIRKRLHHFEVAKELGVSDSWFSVMLRDELPDERKKEIIRVIKKMNI